MKIALDCNALVRWSTGRDADDGARLGSLFEQQDTVLVVPMPAFAEFVIGARGDDVQWLEALARRARFNLVPFGRRAAYECSSIQSRLRTLHPHENKRAPDRGSAWQHVKFDRQILAIALVEGCDLLLCSDEGLTLAARDMGLRSMDVGDLSLPPSAAQRRLDLPNSGDASGPNG